MRLRAVEENNILVTASKPPLQPIAIGQRRLGRRLSEELRTRKHCAAGSSKFYVTKLGKPAGRPQWRVANAGKRVANVWERGDDMSCACRNLSASGECWDRLYCHLSTYSRYYENQKAFIP